MSPIDDNEKTQRRKQPRYVGLQRIRLEEILPNPPNIDKWRPKVEENTEAEGTLINKTEEEIIETK